MTLAPLAPVIGAGTPGRLASPLCQCCGGSHRVVALSFGWSEHYDKVNRPMPQGGSTIVSLCASCRNELRGVLKPYESGDADPPDADVPLAVIPAEYKSRIEAILDRPLLPDDLVRVNELAQMTAASRAVATALARRGLTLCALYLSALAPIKSGEISHFLDDLLTELTSTTICATCEDTHRMTLRDQSVPCTRCPTPCKRCAADNGRGAYCTATPCACECHRASAAAASSPT